MRPRNTALTRLALAQAGLLVVVLAVILVIGYAAMRESVLSEARVIVDGAAAALLAETDLRQNELVIRIAALARDTRDQRSGMLFLLVDANGACPASPPACPVGNVRVWPPDVPASPGFYRSRLGPSIAVRVERIERLGLRLLIGREVAALDGLNGRLAPGLAVGAALAAGAAALLGLVAARRLLARVDAINVFCRSLGGTGLEKRLAIVGDNEFAALSSNINGMLDRIQELMRLLQQLTNHAGHELRTPLAAVRLRLESGLLRTTDAAAQQTIGTAIEQLDDIQDMLARLLEIARSESGDSAGFDRIDLAAVLAPTVAMLAPVAEEATLRLEADLQPAWLMGAGRLLQVAAANLIGNAIKFSHPGGLVVVRTWQAAGRTNLLVEDRGPGIPPDERERVFEHFARVPGTSDRPGHGLGLPLVRAIARRHGMTIELLDAAPGLRVVLSGPATTSDLEIDETR